MTTLTLHFSIPKGTAPCTTGSRSPCAKRCGRTCEPRSRRMRRGGEGRPPDADELAAIMVYACVGSRLGPGHAGRGGHQSCPPLPLRASCRVPLGGHRGLGILPRRLPGLFSADCIEQCLTERTKDGQRDGREERRAAALPLPAPPSMRRHRLTTSGWRASTHAGLYPDVLAEVRRAVAGRPAPRLLDLGWRHRRSRCAGARGGSGRAPQLRGSVAQDGRGRAGNALGDRADVLLCDAETPALSRRLVRRRLVQ